MAFLLICSFFSLCMFIYAGMMLRAAWYFIRIPCENQLASPFPPMVSVVIPARNEAENLPTLLGQVVKQDYPEGFYEVIIVNDDSEDATQAIAYVWAEKYPHLRVINSSPPSDTVAYKKAALKSGIEAARGEIILQTDADCQVGESWISSIVASFGPKTALVSGPVFITHSNHWLERLQSIEMMGLVALGAGSMAADRANLANGANLAFRKKIFELVDGYQGIDQVASGDDELLLQKIRKLQKYELRFSRCRSAIVRTHAVGDWKALKAQRLRWVSKARSYLHRGPNFLQGISYLAFLGLPVLLLMGIADYRSVWIALELYLLKVMADFPLAISSARFFRKLPLLRRDLLRFQLAYPIYVLWIGIAGNIVKQYHWKGRSVR